MESGLPSWAGFIENCVNAKYKSSVSAKELSKLFSSDASSLHLIDASVLGLSREDELQRLRTAIYGKPSKGSFSDQDFKGKKTGIYHHLIVKIAKSLNIPILTLNFDHLFEQACDELNISYKSYYKDRDLKTLLEKRSIGFCIIHVHGYLGPKAEAVKNNLMAGQLNYYREYTSQSNSYKLLSKLIGNYTGIFVGLSLSDHNLNRCLFANKNKREHLWLTRLSNFNQFLRREHEKFWSNLGVEPLYCSDDFSDAYAALRRVANRHEPTVVDYSFKYKEIENFLQSIRSSPLTLKLFDAFDKFEIDIYQDNSDKHAIRMKRVWTHLSNGTGRQSKKLREFSIDWKTGKSQESESAVAYVMDCLSPYIYIRKESQTEMRSWGLIIVPVFSPLLGRCSQILVLKYTNKNNMLNKMISDGGLNSDFHNDILRAVGYITDLALKGVA